MAEHEFAGLRCSEVADLAPSFLLGALEPAEADAVRRHLAACPEAHAEFVELGSVLPALFDSVEIVQPSPALRVRILAAAAADTQVVADTQVAQNVIELPRADTQRGADTQPARRPAIFGRPAWAAIGLAAALALVALGAWNVQLRDQIDGLAAYRNGVALVLDAAAQPGAQVAVLSAPGGSGPSGLAAVSADGAVTLAMQDLAPTSGAQVYEAWLIAEGGAPVPIGGFQVGGGGAASFIAPHATPGSGLTVALTLEPAAGATTPTQPIIAVGTARAST